MKKVNDKTIRYTGQKQVAKSVRTFSRLGWIASLAIACTVGPSFIESGHSQAASLGDLFSSSATSSQPKFLKVEDAFSVSAVQQGNQLTVSLDITPKHYIYKDKVTLKLPEGVTASPFEFSHPSQSIDDPTFGKMAVFKQPQVTAKTTLINQTGQPINQDVTLTWQGCADAGLCYPPQRETVALKLAAAAPSTKTEEKPKPAAKSVAKPSVAQKPVDNSQSNKSNTSAATKTATAVAAKTAADTKSNQSNDEVSTQADAQTTQQQLNENTDTNTAALTDDNQNQTEGLDETLVEEATIENEAVAAGDTTDANTLVQNAALSGDGLSTTDRASLNVEGVVDQDPFGLAEHPWLALLLLFLAGLGLAFTPCVLPMLPIVSNIVARQHNPTARKGLMLSGSYALGVAIAYGVLGAVIAVFGQSLGIIGWLQNPVILLAFAAVFVLLALYMLDVIRIPVPNVIKQKSHAVSQAGDKYLGNSFGSFIAGFLSALVVSPCVSAPLFGALLAVSTIGNPLLGFAALFMLGFGLSAPLMLLGISQGNLMPKAGEWMNWVKQGFALLLFAVALLLIERVFINPMMLMLWAAWFMVVAGWVWTWKGQGQLFSKPVAVILGLWATIILIGAAAGSHDAWQPLRIFNQPNNSQVLQALPNQNTSALTTGVANAAQPSDLHLTRLDDLIPVIEQNDKVLIDLTAEWCVECRIMDKTLFTNRPAEMRSWQLVRLDVTETNAESARILSELNLFGPPALLYFVDGQLKEQQVGTVERSDFEKTLRSL